MAAESEMKLSISRLEQWAMVVRLSKAEAEGDTRDHRATVRSERDRTFGRKKGSCHFPMHGTVGA
jgi:hypothetical protein